MTVGLAHAVAWTRDTSETTSESLIVYDWHDSIGRL